MANEEFGLSKEEIEIIDKQQLQTRFREECKRLPLELLEPYEKDVAEKCLNGETLNGLEMAELKEMLGRYRPYLKKYDSVELEENLEQNLKIIKTSDELLRLLHDPNRFRIDMNYTIGNETFLLKLKIKQLPDSDYISLLDTQTRVFRELNDSEKRVYAKASTNQKLSPEEAKMQKHIQDKINEKAVDYESNAQDITEMLARIVDFVDDPEKTYTEKLYFWEQIDLPARILLFNKIKEKLNIGDKTEEELFPTPR